MTYAGEWIPQQETQVDLYLYHPRGTYSPLPNSGLKMRKNWKKIIGDGNRERKEETEEGSVTSHFAKWQSVEIRILSGREGL